MRACCKGLLLYLSRRDIVLWVLALSWSSLEISELELPYIPIFIILRVSTRRHSRRAWHAQRHHGPVDVA